MFDVIDYGGGNIGSLLRCLSRLSMPYRVINSGSQVYTGNPVILPGVGNFGSVMKSLEERDFVEALIPRLSAGCPFLGICVGLQVLFDESEESPEIEGLGVIPGKVVRFRRGKVPQIGWNRVSSRDKLEGYVYFVNSYHPEPESSDDVFLTADYHQQFCAAIQRDNIMAFQFHPEKSGPFGAELIRRWADAL